MKKFFLAVTLILSATAFTAVNAVNNSTSTTSYTSTSDNVYSVTAFKDPTAGVKVKAFLIISWDGEVCMVLGRDSRYFDTPIRASYSTKYKGYPWVVTINRETWYFAN